jgi:3-oxoadipyl-CoA thiolase
MPEAFLCDGVRTPIGRHGGALAGVRPDDLAALAIRALIQRMPTLDPARIDDVVLGCANQAGEDNRNVARMAALLADLPPSVPGTTVNRLCAGGLQAVGDAARAIRAGDADLIVAGGVESMTRAPFVISKSDRAWSRDAEIFDTTLGWRFINPRLREQHGVDSMSETAENVARDYGVSREDQDQFAARSHQRAAAAAEFLSGEIIPVEVVDRRETRRFTSDEHIRPDATPESLGRLKPIVRGDGSVTAGNASGVNDGAAALILASEAAARREGLTPRARIVGMAASGVAPRIMGVGPVEAVGALLGRLGWSLDHVDGIELNEAFAAQALAVTRTLGLGDDDPRVNPHGGAIALGHPLGMSGARLALTLLRTLEANGGRRGIATLCVGVGQGLALALERV